MFTGLASAACRPARSAQPSRPPGRAGRPPLLLQGRLDAVGAVILDGLSYRRAGQLVAISKTEVGDSLDLLLGALAALGVCQPDGSFVTSLAGLAHRLEETAATGEAACIDGLATRIPRPGPGPTRRCWTTPAPHPHRPGRAVATIHGDLLWCDGGWPSGCHEHELLALLGIGEVLDATEPRSSPGRPRVSWARPVRTGTPRGDRRTTDSAHRPRTRPQPRPGRAACAGRAGHRAPDQRLVAAPLARAHLPRPPCPPRRPPDQLGSLAPADPHLTPFTDTLNDADGNGWILQERPGSRVTVDGSPVGRGEHAWCRRRVRGLDAGG
jgi:hypothetical protein